MEERGAVLGARVPKKKKKREKNYEHEQRVIIYPAIYKFILHRSLSGSAFSLFSRLNFTQHTHSHTQTL